MLVTCSLTSRLLHLPPSSDVAISVLVLGYDDKDGCRLSGVMGLSAG